MRKWTVLHGEEIIDEGEYDFSWADIRSLRDEALTSTDWRAVKDRTMPQTWKDYRQFLRDLPQNFESANAAADAWDAYELPE